MRSSVAVGRLRFLGCVAVGWQSHRNTSSVVGVLLWFCQKKTGVSISYMIRMTLRCSCLMAMLYTDVYISVLARMLQV